jgi:hypothetical protein
VKSDGTWKAQENMPFIEGSPTYFCFYGGVRHRAAIRYDARNEIPGWTSASFDDSAWPAASVVDRSSYRLFAQRVVDQVEYEELTPVSLIPSGADWVADFGKCISGWPQITLREQQHSSLVRIHRFQLADVLRVAGCDESTCKGGTETWRANFGRHTSLKVLRISGVTGTALVPVTVTANHDEPGTTLVGKWTPNTTGEALQATFSSAPAGSMIVITRDARCRNDKGAADRWLSLSLSNQPFESWIRGFYPTATDPAIIGPGADHDHDGLINLEEFAFGLLPDNAKSVNPITDPLNAGTGGFSYIKRSGFSFVVQSSTDLTEWKTDSGVAQNPNPHEDDMKTVRVVLSPSLLVAPSLFVRVQAIPLNN